MGPRSYLHQFLQLALVDAGMSRQELQLLGEDGDALGAAAEKVESDVHSSLNTGFQGKLHIAIISDINSTKDRSDIWRLYFTQVKT